MNTKKKQSKVIIDKDTTPLNQTGEPIADDIQELLDEYLGVPPDLQSLISDYLHIKEHRKRKKKRKK